MTGDYNKKTGAPPESASELTLRVAAALAPDGLLPRGMLRPDASHTILLIGNAGPRMWQRYRRSQASSLDSWTRTVVDPVAAQLDARAIYPFEGPPYAPFHRWALASGTVHQSPIGLLIDKEFGLWHAYRAALSFSRQIDLPPTPSHDSPCETCATQPCLTTCPVGAFASGTFDAGACQGYLDDQAGRDCLDRGCAARRACPVGTEYIYDPPQAAFHMRAFTRNRARR